MQQYEKVYLNNINQFLDSDHEIHQLIYLHKIRRQKRKQRTRGV